MGFYFIFYFFPSLLEALEATWQSHIHQATIDLKVTENCPKCFLSLP